MDFESWEQSSEIKPYVTTAPIGVLVAAWVKLRGQWRVITGKLVERFFEVGSSSNGKLRLSTIKGSVFDIPFDNIIWVKTGSFWPRYLMDHFRMVKAERQKQKQTE